MLLVIGFYILLCFRAELIQCHLILHIRLKYGSLFMWGLGTDYDKAGMLGADKIHMAMVPQFSDQKYIFTDSWSYVLNKASQNNCLLSETECYWL